MKLFSKKNAWMYIVGFVILIGFALTIFFQQSSKRSFDVIKAAPNFELTHYNGELASIENTSGNVRLVYFFFSHCPNVCQPTTYMLSKIQEKLIAEGSLNNGTQIISISFDPERDTQERLAAYAAKFNGDEQGWLFLRGDQSYVFDVAKQYGVGVQALDDGDFAHSNLIFLVDKKDQIRKIYFSDDLDLDNADEIAMDMQALAKQ